MICTKCMTFVWYNCEYTQWYVTDVYASLFVLIAKQHPLSST